MSITNDQRKQNYQMLRSIGFTKEEANRLKGGSPDKIRDMVSQKERIVESIRSEIEVKRQKSGSALKYQTRDDVQARRRANYDALRKAGYSPAEANKLKGAQPIKTQYLVDKKQGKSVGAIHENIKKKLIEAGVKPDAARQMAKMPVDRLQQIVTRTRQPAKITPRSVVYKPRGIQYSPVSEADKKYLSNYTYKVSYIVKKEDGSKEERWITITSPDKMTKKQVKAEARDITTGGGGGGGGTGDISAYEDDGDVLVSSFDIAEAYYNDMM